MSYQKIETYKNIKINNENAISLNNLNIGFNMGKENELSVLENIDYKFKKGQVHFIIGPSGSGKSVLIQHINGLMKPIGGEIFIFDNKINFKKKKLKNVKEIRSRVSICFQFAEFQIFNKTIEKEIMFGPRIFGVKKNEAKQRAKFYLNSVGLDDTYLSKSPFELSGGQKRRVSLASILAIEPDILIFDEPTLGLDPIGEREILDIIVGLKKMGKTIIIITHSINQPLEYGDNVVVLHEKKILTVGNPFDILYDETVLTKINAIEPFVISIIKKLIANDSRYSFLKDKKITNIKQLGEEINEFNK